MEVAEFTHLLKMIELASPNDQEQYWRIPANITAQALDAKADFVAKIYEADNLPLEGVDMALVLNKTVKNKPREKRGPNKWLPMRRAVDPDVAKRISEAAGLKSTESAAAEPKTPKSCPKKGPVSCIRYLQITR